MKLLRLFLIALAATLAATSHSADLRAQQAVSDPNATLTYIHSAWDTLTRSITDCNSLADTKVDNTAASTPVLYLPADLPAPPAVTAIAQTCHIRVIPLPRRILNLGDVRPESCPDDEVAC